MALHPWGFFDVDTRELADANHGALGFRPRVAPLIPTLEPLYRWIEERRYPLVFTTCCSGAMPAPGQVPQAVYVPCDGGDDAWARELAGARLFYLAKKAYGNPAQNAACRAYDMFQDNANAARLVRALAREWVVFGNGFDLCVRAAAEGILAAGLGVTVLQDVRVSSAGGTQESERRTVDGLRDRGARVIPLGRFLADAG